MDQEDCPITNSFIEAMEFAFVLHQNQLRKGSSVPYFAHLLSVAALVMENEGTEEEAIAAILHDAAEDQGGVETLDEIRKRFGSGVASIVHGCSDTFEYPKPPWRERKIAYIERMTNAPLSVLKVSMADKVHNLRSLLDDYFNEGESVWERFNGGKEGTLWYYHQLSVIFIQRSRGTLSLEILRLLDELEALMSASEEEVKE
ncbi:MAG: HD domain-containing protein [Anaerolineales bacterium]|nr:HD domain-containing protein [Anaerolineales bacterium]